MINKTAKNIKMVVFDFDGVFTDNYVYVDQDGREMVRCTRADGIGLSLLRKLGIKLYVLSMEKNSIVKNRCRKLKIECITGCENKLEALKKLLNKNRISAENTCYVGNDTPDLECLKYVGFPVAVPNSHNEVLKTAKYITKAKGGEGAVRELCEYLYKQVME